MELRYKPRPCDRCGAGEIDHEDFSSAMYEDVNPADFKEAPMCSEFHMAYGMVSWLCYKCRSDWHRAIDNNPLSDEYAEAQLRLDFWKSNIVPGSQPEAIHAGVELLREVARIEKEINSFANNWLIR